MAAELTPDTAPEPVLRSPWQRWVGFWFPAADPTTLGFVRICTGLLVLFERWCRRTECCWWW